MSLKIYNFTFMNVLMFILIKCYVHSKLLFFALLIYCSYFFLVTFFDHDCLIETKPFLCKHFWQQFQELQCFCIMKCVFMCVVGCSTEVSLCSGQYFEWRWGCTQWGTAAAVWEAQLPGFLFPRGHTCRHSLLPSQNLSLRVPGGAESLSTAELLHQGNIIIFLIYQMPVLNLKAMMVQ